ncbi:MAG: hypothetical protein IPP16_03515 [Acidimicrobiaceae bacterium]|nr:hypothetical protein [Acidimicrobiaceae bacterium]
MRCAGPGGGPGSLAWAHGVRSTGPDLSKLISAWEEWEAGEQSPGKVLANMKTAGLPQVLRRLVDTGWSPTD